MAKCAWGVAPLCHVGRQGCRQLWQLQPPRMTLEMSCWGECTVSCVRQCSAMAPGRPAGRHPALCQRQCPQCRVSQSKRSARAKLFTRLEPPACTAPSGVCCVVEVALHVCIARLAVSEVVLLRTPPGAQSASPATHRPRPKAACCCTEQARRFKHGECSCILPAPWAQACTHSQLR